MITVLLSAYNEARTIGRTLDSVLSQTIRDVEVLIIDDGSTDGTAGIVSGYSSADCRIRILRNEVNRGLAHSLNTGVRAAEGGLIARIDAGDLCDPQRLEMQVSHLQRFANAGLVGTRAYIIDSNWDAIGEWDVPERVRAATLYGSGGVIHPTIMVRKDVVEAVGGFRPNYPHAEDYDFWFRVLRGGYEIHNLPQYLTSCMERSAGISRRHSRRMVWDTMRVKAANLRHFPSVPNAISLARSAAGYCLPRSLYNAIMRRYSAALCDKRYFSQTA